MPTDELTPENSTDTVLIISGYRSQVYHTSRDCPHVQKADDIRRVEKTQYPDREECREKHCGDAREPNSGYDTKHREAALDANPDDIHADGSWRTNGGSSA